MPDALANRPADSAAEAPRPDAGPPLLLTAKGAAAALSLSERTLWSLTAPRGPIRPVRVGRLVRYAPSELQRWIEARQRAAAEA